ncbi:MAG: coproporphyrinogen dehydrogenase HemZ [Oscillospiraceae bacterium]|jgi:oxygen-independent coproporphyrinogen-3 oxidase
MTLYLNGHTYKYELEHLIKMFFPLIKLGIVYDGTEGDENAVVTTRTEEESEARLTVTVRYHGEVMSRIQTVDRFRADYSAECERVFAVMIYEILEEFTGLHPKWGILTGIRPVKLVSQRLAEQSEEQIVTAFERDLKVTPQKTRLLIDIARIQRPVASAIRERDFSIYVSIPFCPSRCQYCSFVSHSVEQAKKLIPDYLDRLCDEIRETAKRTKQLGLVPKTVYFGGGTPTVLEAEQLSRLFGTLEEAFDLSGLLEYTVEAGRADTITREKLEAIRAAGATRISINPQSFDDEVLREIGRKHTAAQVVACYQLARELGFDNINMDFIAGLKGDTLEGFCATMQTALSLAPENITVHTLSVKRSSNLYNDAEAIAEVRRNPTAEMADAAQKMLGEAGYLPYYLYRQKNTLQNLENVGFCKPGYEGIYNIYMMEELETVLAFGAGAVSKLVDQQSGYIERIFNYKFPYEYIGQFGEMLERKGKVKAFYEREGFCKTE